MENNQLSPGAALVRRRVRILGIALVFSVLTNILFITYAFVQKNQALQSEMKAIKAQHEAVVSMDISQHRSTAQTEQITILRDSLAAVKKEINSLKSKARK